MSTLPRFVAEEMDADWSKVLCEHAPADEKTYGNPLFWGIQITAGSRTCMGYADVLRQAGAQARFVLVSAAARKWNVPASELNTRQGFVEHASTQQRIGYGDLVSIAEVPQKLPDFVDHELKPQLVDDFFGEAPPSPLLADKSRPDAIALKSQKQFQLLGVDGPRVDLPEKVNGSARFGIDSQLPDLVYAMVETAPVLGASPESVDDGKARSAQGVLDVIRLPYGVAIIGSSIPAVWAARKLLNVTWSKPAAQFDYSSQATMDEFARIAADANEQPGVRTFDLGDPQALTRALSGKGVMTFDMRSELVYHAPIEPQNATLRLAADGKSAEAWVSTQWPTLEKDSAAKVLGLKPDDITLHIPLAGGSFGRRQEPGAIVDAAHIARQVRKPVKVIWTREDDLKRNPFRQALTCHIDAAVAPDGTIKAMRHRVVSDSWFARLFPDWFEQYHKTDPGSWTGALQAYEIPLQSIDCVTERRAVDVCYMRGIGVAQVKFAQESLIDRIALTHHQDPLEFRLRMLKRSPRAVQVLQTVAEMADWKRPRAADRAIGLAYIPYSNSHAALVAEVSVDRKSGQIRVHEVWCAADAGFAVQPAIAASQLEGGILMGLSIALFERVTLKHGRVEQSNFDDYRILRMSETPEITVKVLSTDNPITGIAEIGVMPIAPAVNNAVARLTGKHLSNLPMTADVVTTALRMKQA